MLSVNEVSSGGCIARDAAGDLIRATATTAMHAEVLVLRMALTTAISAGWTRVWAVSGAYPVYS